MSPTATRAWTPDDPRPRGLWEAFGVAPGGVVTLVGAGGKTTLAHALADEAAAGGARVLVTTTTKMALEEGVVSDVGAAARALESDSVVPDAFRAGSPPSAPASGTTGSDFPGRQGRVVVAGVVVGADKMGPFAPAELDRLRRAADVTVVEGDGSRRLPFKVPAAHEPVVPGFTDLLVIVAGASALGRPLGEVCCRVEVAAAILGVADAAALPLDAATAATLLRAGYLDRPALARWAGRRVVVLNQADDEPSGRLGRAVADALPGERVVLASNRFPAHEVPAREVPAHEVPAHERVAR